MSRSVVYIIDSLDALDDSLQLNLLVAEMRRSGDWETHVAVIAPLSDSSNPLIGLDVKIHRLTDRPRSANSVTGVTAVLLAARALSRVLESARPDVVHTWGLTAQRCMGASKMMMNQSGAPDPKWIGSFVRKPEKSSFVASALDRLICKQLEKVFVPHECLKQSALETGFTEQQLVVVPNAAVALPVRNAAKDEMREKLLARIGLTGQTVIVAGTVADLIPSTRVKDLIWATDLLNCIRDDFHFVIFGDGHQRENLERFAHFTEAASHVHFLLPEEAEGLMGALDVYWHSHLLHPLPSPLLSAMASAVPVISVYGDGTEEVILHQQTGLAVNFGARDEFARWTKFLIEKPDAAQQLADQGKAHVWKQFPLEAMVAGYQPKL